MSLDQPFRSEAYDRLMADQVRILAKNVASLKAADAIAAMFAPPEFDLATPVTDLRIARERLGLTQAALAERLGTDAPRLSQIENGKPIPAWLDLAMRALLALEAK